MLDIESFKFHPLTEKLVKVLKNKTQSNNENFFRVLANYHLTKLASVMRTGIATHDRGLIPVNMYTIALAPSGTGKGYATNIIEENIINPFKDIFMATTFQSVAEKNITKIATARAHKAQTDFDDEFEIAAKEFISLGHMLFSFDSGTTPAVKQMRHKLLMADSGALSMEIDEIGSNLLGNVEVLSTFLELYDVGKVKPKLIKNTAENVRNQDIDGKTPTNMILFGTPDKVLDGYKVEKEFFSMQETGFARRCTFAYETKSDTNLITDPAELYTILTDSSIDTDLEAVSKAIIPLANEKYFNQELPMSKAVHLLLLEYKIQCITAGSKMKHHESLKKTELEHRYYKALKLSGTYAFVDQSPEVTEDHIKYAIKSIEQSGENFEAIYKRDKNYMMLAKFLAEVSNEITQVDLVENLTFYTGSEAAKREMMTLATAWGYKNNIIIQRSFIDDIEFLTGKTLAETNLDEITISYSEDTAVDYECEIVPFDKLDILCGSSDHYFCVHEFSGNYRTSENCIPGFDMIVLDIDEFVTLDSAITLLNEYKFKIYTTKSHTEDEHRFRVLLPMSHRLELSPEDYSDFMENVFEWLPFGVDDATKDISRKWAGNTDAEFFNNEGILIDATLFIPKTKKEEDNRKYLGTFKNMTSMERWFLRNTKAHHNRSKMLLRYALVMKDSGYPLEAIHNLVNEFNKKLPDPISEKEINGTIMVTVAKRLGQ